MAEIVYLETPTTLPIPVDRVLIGAAEAKLTEVVICGWKEDGGFFFASSEAAPSLIGHVLDLAKASLIKGQFVE